ncbi:hybrid sensor histidine kinase/response regulator [Azospirillum sp. RWY-5-1]|uniref:histidine kinase n=1 Tax=Azospirillum oleiclasticum TaxID=2735135 RepID=A0ABX2T3B1_9PROT|nr:hybrid sensor histidine kinase/response regulator [Azospirillum oleiclasticum]NYZ18797.1 hybrid sensor histidine kinase/response regulator [Azospirillum oleiclasticum]
MALTANDDVGWGAVLVFDRDGTLLSWSAEVPRLEGAPAGLVRGMPRAAFATLFDRHVVAETALADGGSVCAFQSGRPAPVPSGRLFAAASHDLRQPLAALSLLMGVLDDRVRDRDARDLLTSATAALQSMRAKIDGHLDLARLQAGLLETEVGLHAVNGVLMRLALDFSPRFQSRGLRFSVLPSSTLVRTDPTLLERILSALLENALRHTGEGRVILGCRRSAGTLRIEVWDTAGGLDPERLTALRQALSQPVPMFGDGLGLGLILAAGLSRRLGHRLDVRSVTGQGTVFSITLPGVADTGSSTQIAPESGGADLYVGRANVLIIEDDRLVLEALDTLLRQWGCVTTGADSFDQATERLNGAEAAPDLIIADLRLKGAANGIVAIRQISRSLGTDVPGLILTGETDPIRLREARLSGYPILHKPFPPLALRALVARLLGRTTLSV